MCSILRPKEVAAMSFIVTVKIPGDTNAFTKSLEERADEYREISGRGREAGAIHHQFAVGDGFILVVDEWESAAAFEKFFSAPDLKAFIGSVGGDPNSAPEITVGEALDSPDKF
jgi:quinol monooxygenase YgiN